MGVEERAGRENTDGRAMGGVEFHGRIRNLEVVWPGQPVSSSQISWWVLNFLETAVRLEISKISCEPHSVQQQQYSDTPAFPILHNLACYVCLIAQSPSHLERSYIVSLVF